MIEAAAHALWLQTQVLVLAVGGALLLRRLALRWAGLGWQLVRTHRRLLRTLRPAPDASHWRLPAACGPALVGVWRPRLYLPEDFEQRFDAAERQAILLHEAAHRARCDTGWNLLATVWALLHWFNPLAWWALQRMRADQELSCDALVLGAPSAPPVAVYARALLKSQGLAWPIASTGFMRLTGTATSWQSVHPLLERVSMLKTHHRHGAQAWRARGLAAAFCLLYAGLGQALQGSASAAPGDTPGTVAVPPLSPAALAPAAAAATANAGATPNANAVMLVMTLEVAGKTVAQPRLVVKEGEPARVEVGGGPGREAFSLNIVARRADKPEMTGLAAPGPAKPRP